MAADAYEAADRMAAWIGQRHFDAHDIVAREIGEDPTEDGCEGCKAMRDYLKARSKDAV